MTFGNGSFLESLSFFSSSSFPASSIVCENVETRSKTLKNFKGFKSSQDRLTVTSQNKKFQILLKTVFCVVQMFYL